MTLLRCICDYAAQDEDQGRYIRSNPRTLCPKHDSCQLCDERPAVRWAYGDKVCELCAEYLAGRGEAA